MRSTTLFILSTSSLTSTTSAFSLLLTTRGSSSNINNNKIAMNMNKLTPVPDASALAEFEVELEINDERFLQKKQEVYDPLGLYTQYSPERLFDSIQPLASSLIKQQNKTIIDPINIYQDKSHLSSDVVMSASLPFLKRPTNLNGRLLSYKIYY
eukprot:CAMPEP_0170838388 /NCGR_PEP_ID=MMETSP0734-20130129/3372_1 /TAXON_ID=186038 /ORGANISM="Fragilariopsis kerguelensis, Strain L26-C5" /LENGTH=153 /DNA_ID=CAMNT_0011205835 /DNA_START=22 /DNA_END=483 /DNA_ORIENTATION=+